VSIQVIVVASRARDPLASIADEYLQRVSRVVRAEAFRVEASRRGRKDDDDRLRTKEAELLLKRTGAAQLIALDQRGSALSSEQLAKRLQQWIAQGDVAFAIGGATGLHDSVLQRATFTLSLGPMTLPHRLARLLLCEQLYRATAIWRNEPYHK